ncbi:heterokaryon incompatibility protein-domain-containing protein [Echria macrotheca]|uniref:Heterokaryon incompatibility protein-domain-containing protein n=1 Tax=Echria macrotheca TaxID=438768 RepID=A0AAJ0FD25_9PEZI|nr:heterokaryon incompatibility protein-domain-containing protein [Echria macrotheca]
MEPGPTIDNHEAGAEHGGIPLPPSTAFFNQIKEWVAECGSRHGPCPMLHSDPPPLPTRVLKITAHENSFRVQLHLGGDQEAWYVTLSHCWGKHQPITTTKKNLPDHLLDIKWDELPRTFQDAVVVTHNMGIQYLWIDSLCIVQDDKEDWDKESDSMHQIYSKSYLTIGAALGKDSRHGLFPDVDDIARDGPVNCIRDVLTTNDSPAPLTNRAWVFQERLLSQRVLYFCGQEVVMECSNDTRCQCSDIDTHLARLREPPTGRWDLAPKIPFHVSAKSLALWDELLHCYCRRKITRLSDRVTALTGIAGTFGSTGAYGQYYAGLWACWFVHMLLWYIDIPPEGENDDLLPQPYSVDDPPVSPSWSWAKVRGSWLYARPRTTVFQRAIAELKAGELHLTKKSEYGRVEKGVATIKGGLFRATIRYNFVPHIFTHAQRFRRQDAKVVVGNQLVSMHKDFVLDDEPEPVLSGDTVYLLPLVSDETDLHYFQLQSNMYHVEGGVRGLVLRSVEGGLGVYARIGVFHGPERLLKCLLECGAEAREVVIC